jgi:uncharacterized UBP type Zn finger protein
VTLTKQNRYTSIYLRRCVGNGHCVGGHCAGGAGSVRATDTVGSGLGCDARENLWMCLVCGHLACSRAQWHGGADGNVIESQGHALAHHMETGHAFAKDLDSRRVWDYKNDRYTCRLAVGGDAATA